MMETDTDASLARKSLDRAIANLAEAEYRRLGWGLGDNERRKYVDGALQSLKKLRQGRRPNYGDEWVALFYLTWYQPRQIQLAYAALRGLISERQPPKYIIDYGCGAWAIQIALALRIAEVDVHRSESGAIAVHGIDPNQPMTGIGGKLWREFRRIVSEESAQHSVLEPLHDALDRMDELCTCHTSYDAYAESQGVQKPLVFGDCWLTAVHVVDELNQDHLCRVFEYIRQERAPAIELFTTDASKLDQTGFFGATVYGVQQRVWPREELQRTTAWRQGLRLRLGVKRDGSLLDQYLDRSVTWDTMNRLTNNKDIVRIRRGVQR